MPDRNRLAALLAISLLSLGVAACDETTQESDQPGIQQDSGEGAEPAGGVGEDGVEGEGALD
jgi:hypothetical protein